MLTLFELNYFRLKSHCSAAADQSSSMQNTADKSNKLTEYSFLSLLFCNLWNKVNMRLENI